MRSGPRGAGGSGGTRTAGFGGPHRSPGYPPYRPVERLPYPRGVTRGTAPVPPQARGVTRGRIVPPQNGVSGPNGADPHYSASVRLVIARCSVDYVGRLTAHLPLATRLLLVKADGSVLVHSDGGSYKPLNWMSPPCTLVEEPTGRGRSPTRPASS